MWSLELALVLVEGPASAFASTRGWCRAGAGGALEEGAFVMNVDRMALGDMLAAALVMLTRALDSEKGSAPALPVCKSSIAHQQTRHPSALCKPPRARASRAPRAKQSLVRAVIAMPCKKL